MTATRIDPRPQQVPPYQPVPTGQQRRNLRAVAVLRAALVPTPVIDPAHHRAATALAKTQRRVTTTNPRSTP